MKAIIQDRYGTADDLRYGDLPVPEPAADEVLVQVRAASVHADVWHVISGKPYVLRVMGNGFLRPKDQVPGTDVAGTVAAVGSGVTGLAVGDRVFGETLRGHQWHNGGAFAEYCAVPAANLAPIPEGVTFEEAAAVPTSGYIALQAVHEQADVRLGDEVLVNGAGGAVGSLAVQLARAFGGRVTAVDTGAKLPALRELGAAEVIDYTEQDYTAAGPFDVIIDIPGNRSLRENLQALRPDGRYVLVGHDQYGEHGRKWLGSIPTMLKLTARTPFTKQLPNLNAPPTPNRAGVLSTLLARGELTPRVARTFPLDQAAEALRELARQKDVGKIVLTVDPTDGAPG